MTDNLLKFIPQPFDALCKFLSPCTGREEAEALCGPGGAVDWEGVAVFANRANLAPALQQALVAKGVWNALPEQFQDYLDAMRCLNGERNAAIFSQQYEIIAILNKAGIIPLLLKGGAALAMDLYPEQAVRFMMDLDLLVPESLHEQAVTALNSAGYSVPDPHGKDLARWGLKQSTHYPPLVRPGMPVHVEIHRQLLHDPINHLLPSEAVWQRSCPGANGRMEGVFFALMAPTDQILHCIVHAQVAHMNYDLQRLDLRQLVHFAHLCQRYGGEIAWEELALASSENELEQPLRAWLYAAHLLLGLVTPLTPEPDAGLHRHFSGIMLNHFAENGRTLRVCRSLFAHVQEAFSAQGLQLRFPEEQGCSAGRLRLKLLMVLLERYPSVAKVSIFLKRKVASFVSLG